MTKILLSDPESKDYDIRKMLAGSGLSGFEIVDEPDSKKARERIEKKEKFDAAVFGYDFNNGDAFGIINFLIRHRETPSIVLVYPSETGVSNYARKYGIKYVERNEIGVSLGDAVKRKISKNF